MAHFLELKRRAEKLILESESLAKRLGFDSVAEGIGQSLEQLRRKEMMVVVAGEARRGKSSLLNALLNAKEEIFPVDVNVCTNVVTVLRYGREGKLEVVLEGGKTETLPMDQHLISDYVSEKGNPNNYKNVRLLNVYLPIEALKDGVVFVDTPGVGSLNIEHAETTYAFLPNADLLIFVSDTNSGFTETELDFLKRGYEYCKNVVFPLTKKDLNANYGIIAEDNREKIHRTLGIPKDEIQIVPVSSSAKLRYLERGAKSLYTNSNYEQLEKTIWDTITTTRASVAIQPYLYQVCEHLMKIQDSMAAQFQMLHAGQEKAQELVEELKREIQQQKDLQESGAQWRVEINRFGSTLGYQIEPIIQSTNLAATECLEEALQIYNNAICKEKNYVQVISDINHHISCGMLQIRALLEEELGKKCEELQTELGLNVTINETAMGKMQFKPNDTLAVTFPKRKNIERISSSGRKIGSNSFAFGSVGAVLGGVVGFFTMGPLGAYYGAQVGGLLGGAVGSTKGCVEALRKHDEVDREFVNKTIRRHIATSISSMRNNVNSSTTEVRIALNAMFEQQLKQRAQTMQENINQLQKNVQLSRAEVPERLGELQRQDKSLKDVFGKLQAMEEEIQKLADASLEPEQLHTQSVPAGEPASYGFL